jgi:hypothetical protein
VDYRLRDNVVSHDLANLIDAQGIGFDCSWEIETSDVATVQGEVWNPKLAIKEYPTITL